MLRLKGDEFHLRLHLLNKKDHLPGEGLHLQRRDHQGEPNHPQGGQGLHEEDHDPQEDDHDLQENDHDLQEDSHDLQEDSHDLQEGGHDLQKEHCLQEEDPNHQKENHTYNKVV